MGKFKVGEAKTRDGSDVVIFEVSDKIYTKRLLKDGSWTQDVFNLNGKWFGSMIRDIDLIPNVEPLRAEFGELVKEGRIYENSRSFTRNIVIVPDEFAGMYVKVTIEAME